MHEATFEPRNRPLDEAVLFGRLSQGIDGTATRVFIGLNWTIVLTATGAGLAHTPDRGTAGCRSLPNPGSYTAQSVQSLAALWNSENPFERSIAIAAMNAHWNRFDLEADTVNGLDLIEDHGAKTVIVGRFPGLEKHLPGAAVVEKEPGPDDLPEDALDDLLPAARFVAVTGSTIVNGSLPGILSRIENAYVVLIGPSTPLSPALFELGVDALSGFVVTDADGCLRVIGEGGSVRAMRPYGRFATLQRDPSSASQGADGPMRSTR